MKILNSKLGRLAIAGVIAAGAVVGISLAANAAGGTGCATLTYPLCARSVAGTQVVDGSLNEREFDADTRAKLNAPDAKGASSLKAVYNDKLIDNTGGSWKTRRTVLGTITVPAGKWTIDASVQFQRTAAQDAGDLPTRPQLALRVGASDTSFGDTVGTIGGNDISPVVEGDLFGSDSRLVEFPETTVVEVSAFGYEDDRGSSDSGKIKVVNALISITQG